MAAATTLLSDDVPSSTLLALALVALVIAWRRSRRRAAEAAWTARPAVSGAGGKEMNGRAGAKNGPDEGLRPWMMAPRLKTWPWLGDMLSYTKDPCGFIRREHERFGDVFTTTILGYSCTFLQSQRHLTTFATSNRRVLDVTRAYKLVAAPLIGEEAFIGQTRYLYQALGHNRIERLAPNLWKFASEQYDEALARQGVRRDGSTSSTRIDLGEVLHEVVFGMDAFVLCGKDLAQRHGRRLGTVFRAMDVDLSLLGLVMASVSRARMRAKRELFELVRGDVRRRLQTFVESSSMANGSAYAEEGSSHEERPREKGDEEFAEYLLRKELEDGGEGGLLAAAQGDAEAQKALDAKAREVALVIYGLIWAAQTNAAASTIWIVYDLLHQPGGHLERIRKELHAARKSSPSTADRLPPFEMIPHLLSCINETLRLRVTGAWLRYAAEPLYLAPTDGSDVFGLVCPPGFVVASPFGIARNEEVYPDAERWDPDRYSRPPFAEGGRSDVLPLDGLRSPPISSTASLFGAWGLGNTQCPGRNLAYRMMATAVALLVEGYDVALVEDPAGRGRGKKDSMDVAAAGVQRFLSRLVVDIRPRPSGDRPGEGAGVGKDD